MLLPLSCRYEGIISLLCENLDTLDEPEAKAAMVWVLGEPPAAFLQGFAVGLAAWDPWLLVACCRLLRQTLDGTCALRRTLAALSHI